MRTCRSPEILSMPCGLPCMQPTFNSSLGKWRQRFPKHTGSLASSKVIRRLKWKSHWAWWAGPDACLQMYMKTNACTPYTVFSSRETHAYTCAHDTQGKIRKSPDRASFAFPRREKHNTSHTERSKRMLDILYPSRLRLNFDLAL